MSKTNRLLFLLLLLACATLATGCACTPNASGADVAVAIKPQQTNNWCWAATTQMITETLGHGRAQCDLANQRFGLTVCCNGTCPKDASCNMPGWTMFDESNFNTTATPAPLAWDALQRQISCTQKPMAYAYGPKSGGVGHVVVVSGYRVVNGIRFVRITDPWDPCDGESRSITYEEYSNSGTTDHWETNYDITWRG